MDIIVKELENIKEKFGTPRKTKIIDAILNYNIESLKTIILVNRNHHKFPIKADYVGLNLSTTLKEHIEVKLTKGKETAYLI